MTEPQNELKILVQDRKKHENGQLMVGRSQFAVFCLKIIAHVVVWRRSIFKIWKYRMSRHRIIRSSSNMKSDTLCLVTPAFMWYYLFILSKHFSAPKMRRLRKHEKQKTYASTESWVSHNFRIHLFIFVILWETRVLHKAFEHEWIWWFDKFAKKKKLSHIWYVTMCGIIKYSIISLCFVVERVEA